MKFPGFLTPLLVAVFSVQADESARGVPGHAAPGGSWEYREIRRFPAVEARQGVAVDAEHLYVISNHALGKYRRASGERVGGWECPEGEPLIHLNAGLVVDGILHCAHSNFPGVPMFSSIERWDTETMEHVGTQSFGRTDGSLTWFDRHGDGWVACFVHYGRRGGEPDRGPEWTRLVHYDSDWKERGGWVFPADLMTKLAERGYSVSGGAFGPGGYLYVTGHDHAELYVLEMPTAGYTLKWIDTVPIATEGQAFAWDKDDPGRFFSISKRDREVVEGKVDRITPKE